MNRFNLTAHLSEQGPCAMSLNQAISAKEAKLVDAEKVLRLCMALSSPATQMKLLTAIWPGIQTIETNLLTLRDMRAAELCKMQVRKDWREAA